MEIIMFVLCDADLRETNSQVNESSKNCTLGEAIKKYTEWEYRRGLVFGWGRDI